MTTIYKKIEDSTITPRFKHTNLAYWVLWYSVHKKAATIKRIERLYREKKFEPFVAFVKYPREEWPGKSHFPVFFFITNLNTYDKGKFIVKTLQYRCKRSARNRHGVIACKSNEDNTIIDRLPTIV